MIAMDQTKIPLPELFSQSPVLADLKPSDVAITSRSDNGGSGHALYDLRLKSNDSNAAPAPRWILKHWSPGQKGYYNLGIEHCIEGYAFHRGVFKQLPPGIHVPIIAATQVETDRSVWLVMDDVSFELSQYGRTHQRPYDIAEARLRTILSWLARFHVHWESSQLLADLEQEQKTLDISNVMWLYATLYSSALGEAPRYHATIGKVADPEITARLIAFLDWLPNDIRPLWRDALIDRHNLVEEIIALPHTLLHGDLDDRNVGLRYRSGSETAAGLVLIDWEFCGIGPAGVDVGKLLLQFGGVVDLQNAPTVSIRQFVDDLSNHYATEYRRYGGSACSQEQLTKGIQLGFVKECLAPVSLVFGELILAAQQSGKYEAVHTPGFDKENVVDGFVEMALHWAAEVVDCATLYMQRHMQ